VYQDKALGDQQSVEWNIFMGREIAGPLGTIRLKKQREETMKLMREMGFTSKLLKPESIVMNCSGGEREGSCIVIMHNIYHAYRIAERFVIMGRGRIAQLIRKAEIQCDELIERMAMIVNESKTCAE
jgi:simple sugar transport system ATP-binding protein